MGLGEVVEAARCSLVRSSLDEPYLGFRILLVKGLWA